MKAMNKLFVAAVIATSLTACQQESFEVRTDSDNYYASVETFATGTKTVLGENRSVVWSSEDRIAIFEGKDVGQAYQVLDSYVGKSSGEFAEVEGLVTEGTDAAIEGSIAVYPFNEALTVTSGDNGDYVIEGVTFPSEQKYVAGSFSDEAFPMVAVTSDKNLSFKNVGGVLKLSLTGSYSVSSITLTGNSGELLSGPATVTLGPDGIPSVTMSDDASTSVTLLCDPAVELDPEKATDFNISIPPTVFEEGFNISIIDSYGESRGKSTDKLNKVERSKMLVMPELANSDYAYIDLSNNPEWETGIIAEDGRYLLVKKDTTNNGYISYINSSAFDSDGIVLYYDKNIELLSFVTNKGACYINREADNADIILVLDDESHIYENITLNTIEIAMTKAAPVVPIIVGVATGIATVKNIWDTVQATKELNDGNWDGARLDYLKLLGGTAAKNPFGGFVIDGAFGVLDKAKKDLDMKGQTCFLGNCQILMKQTKIGLKKFRIDVTVTGYETLPIISKITGEKSVVIGGIAVRDLPYVSYSNNEYLLEEWIINGNGTKSIEFELPEDRTYYAVPYLLPTRGGKYPFKGNVRYGNTMKLPYFYGVIDQFKQTSFSENNDKYVFKCYAHAICNPKDDDFWKLYYEDDRGQKIFFNSKNYDEPSISNNNSAEFEFEIELESDLFEKGKKDIKLGVATFTRDYSVMLASDPQLFELTTLPTIEIENIDVLYAIDQGVNYVICGLELNIDTSSIADNYKDKKLDCRLLINERDSGARFNMDSNSDIIRLDSIYVRRTYWEYTDGAYTAECMIDICNNSDNHIITSEPYNKKIQMNPLPVKLDVLLGGMEIYTTEYETFYVQSYCWFCNSGTPEIDYKENSDFRFDDKGGTFPKIFISCINNCDRLQLKSLYCYHTYTINGKIEEGESCLFDSNRLLNIGGACFMFEKSSEGTRYDYGDIKSTFVATLNDETKLTETIVFAPSQVSP